MSHENILTKPDDEDKRQNDLKFLKKPERQKAIHKK